MSFIGLRDLERELDYRENQSSDNLSIYNNEICRFLFEKSEAGVGSVRKHYSMLLNIALSTAKIFYPQLNKPEENK